MNRYYGMIGFSEVHETKPELGIWEETDVIERPYYGQIESYRKSVQSGMGVNDDVLLKNKVSIIADPYLNNNMMNIKYVTWMNQKWKVSEVEPAYPRLILTLGGLYHEETD